jgi:hypothetical protein
VIRNRVQSYKYMYLWLILYRSYDAPTGYLPHLPSIAPGGPFVSGACTPRHVRRRGCLIFANSGQVSRQKLLSGDDESAPCHLQTLPRPPVSLLQTLPLPYCLLQLPILTW